MQERQSLKYNNYLFLSGEVLVIYVYIRDRYVNKINYKPTPTPKMEKKNYSETEFVNF